MLSFEIRYERPGRRRTSMFKKTRAISVYDENNRLNKKNCPFSPVIRRPISQTPRII